MENIKEAHSLYSNILMPYQAEMKARLVKHGCDHWPTPTRDFRSYMEDFAEVVDKVALEDELQRLESPVVIDLMSPSDALVSLLAGLPQRDKLGIAVSLGDDRSSHERDRDQRLGIFQIAGDLSKSATWAEIRRTLVGKKANLIVEGALDGVAKLPTDRRLYGLMLNRAWSLLDNNGGTLLAEIPAWNRLDDADVDTRTWRGMLQELRIDFSYSNELGCGFLRLRKTPDSPQRLPLLS